MPRSDHPGRDLSRPLLFGQLAMSERVKVIFREFGKSEMEQANAEPRNGSRMAAFAVRPARRVARADELVHLHRLRVVQHHGAHPWCDLRRGIDAKPQMPGVPSSGHGQAERAAKQLGARHRMELQQTQEERPRIPGSNRMPLVRRAVHGGQPQDGRPYTAAVTRRRRRADRGGVQIMQFPQRRETQVKAPCAGSRVGAVCICKCMTCT